MGTQVQILLATYNGVKYLGEQLKSIDCQTVPVARVTIRDDESTDGTQSFLQEWAVGRSNVRLFRGPRLGVTNNFFALLKDSEKACRYCAFCDQDDVWLPSKIERAVAHLSQYSPDGPLMYCSRLEYVDEDLHHLGYSRLPRRLDFANALVENVCTGCTIVLNRRAADLICERLPGRALLHDWWCYLVISTLGKVIFDETPTVRYRQHSNNQVGAATSHAASLKGRLQRLLRSRSGVQLLTEQAAEFKRCFGDLLNPHDKDILERFLAVRGGLWSRASYSAAMDVRRQSWVDTAILRTMILIGRV